MRTYSLIILFFAAFIADSVIMPVIFNSKGGFLAVILILAWILSGDISKRGFLGFCAFLILEILWGLDWGVFSLPFALIILLFFVASRFLNTGHAGFMRNNMLAGIAALAAVNSCLFYIFNFFSLLTENIFYNSADSIALLPPLFSRSGLFYVFAASACCLFAFNMSGRGTDGKL